MPNRKNGIELVKLGLIGLAPIIFLLTAYFTGFFDIAIGSLTLRIIWDIFWIGSVIWIGIALIIYAIGYYLGMFKDGHKLRIFKVISGSLPFIIFWSIVAVRGIADTAFNVLTFQVFWDIFWIGLLIWLGCIILIYTAGYFTGYLKN